MRYCILCGVHITQKLPELWLKEFRAVWIEQDNWHDVRLSGVGICDEYDDVVIGVVPEDPHKRYDDPPNADSMIDVSLMRHSLKSLVYPGTARNPEPFWGYGFHSSCWGIFSAGFSPNLVRLFEACISMPTRSSILNWGHDYNGAALLQESEVPTLGSRFPSLESLPRDLRSDPLNTDSLQRAITHATRLQAGAFQSHLDPSKQSLEGDSFSQLPPEVLQLISILLPTRDLRSLRLASPVFATLSLSEKFWASRFQEGREFDHIIEVLSNPPESWRSLYLSLKTLSHNNPSLANRKRMWGLAKGLQAMLCEMEDVLCAGLALKSWFEPFAMDEAQKHEGISWHTASRGVTRPDRIFRHGCRVLRTRALYLPQPLELQSMSVSFIQTPGGLFVSGLLFIEKNTQRHSLGYFHSGKCVTIELPAPQVIQGWRLALDISGVRAIALVTENGIISSWAGEPGPFPRWHLARPQGVSAIKAEFDALKLVSLSRDDLSDISDQSLWHSSCLWFPDVPPERMLFNGSEGNAPPNDFDLPINTLFFGGSNGELLVSLVEIVIWTFDISCIAGIEFIYSDSSKNQQLGRTGPFDGNHPVQRRFSPPEDHRTSLLIAGSEGEELKSIQVQTDGQYLTGLKIHTNLNREFSSPECPAGADEDWIAIYPQGSRVVGLFYTPGHLLSDLGLISTSSNIEDE